METIPLDRIVWEAAGRIFVVGASIASIRAILAIIAKRGRKKSRISYITVLEACMLLFLAAFMGLGVKVYNLAKVERVYSAKEVEAGLKPAIINRKEPSGQPKIQALPYDDQQNWMADHVYWLEKEGDAEKSAGKVGWYVVAEVRYIAPFHTKGFSFRSWVVTKDSTIHSRAAFRTTNIAGALIMERLKIKPGSAAFDAIQVSVPQCAPGDEMIILVRVSGKSGNPPKDLQDIVRSRFE